MPTPNWQAARNGFPGDTNATNHAAEVNQLLGLHASTQIYQGNPILVPSDGAPTGSGYGGINPNYHLDAFDYDQPFTMSGTQIGRIVVPITPAGNGADLEVSLYTDNAGEPGTLVQSTRIPASWITAFAAVTAFAGQTDYTPTAPGGNTALALPQYNALRIGNGGDTARQSPAFVVGPSGYAAGGTYDPTSGYVITAGGYQTASTASPNVYTTQWTGGSVLAPSIPQSALPYAVGEPNIAIVNGDTVVVFGGAVASNPSTNVVTASWDASSGTIGAWSDQQALPIGLTNGGTAVWNSTVYAVGGQIPSGSPTSAVYYATVTNSQLQAWSTGPSLPIALQYVAAAVIGDVLYAVGGLESGGTTATRAAYAAPIHADGSLGPWQSAPSLPLAVSNYNGSVGVSAAGLVMQGQNPAGTEFPTQTLSIGPTGPGVWQQQNLNFMGVSGLMAMFPVGPGQWQVFDFFDASYGYGTAYTVPMISVPMPVSGLTNGGTYHVVLHQVGGDLNDFLLTWVEGGALPDAFGESAPGSGGPWTYYSGFSVPIFIYDQTVAGQIWHTWEDSGARITTLAYATTPDQRLLGGAESTQFGDGTCLAECWAVNYPGDAAGNGPGTPGAIWPPIGVTLL